MGAARQFSITGFYGESLPELVEKIRVSPETVQKLVDTYQKKPFPRRMRAVSAPSAVEFKDLSPELQARVERACAERGIAISQVEIISLRKVVIP